MLELFIDRCLVRIQIEESVVDAQLFEPHNVFFDFFNRARQRGSAAIARHAVRAHDDQESGEIAWPPRYNRKLGRRKGEKLLRYVFSTLRAVDNNACLPYSIFFGSRNYTRLPLSVTLGFEDSSSVRKV